jgi:hypothetical protein
MRIIECPECNGLGGIDEGYDKWQCAYCHGYGKMNVREWFYWKFLTSEIINEYGWLKLKCLLFLWNLTEIGERKRSRNGNRT